MKIISIRLLSTISLSTSLTAILFVPQAKALETVANTQEDQSTTLIAQNVVTVTSISINQTPEGLELVLETPSNNQSLVPSFSSQEEDLIIDIFDATLLLPEGDRILETNPVPGIKEIAVISVGENAIRIIVTGENQAPSANIIPSENNLVLSISPQIATTETPRDEVEIIVTAKTEEEENYFVPDASVTRTNTPIIDTPATVQVVPRELFEDQQITEFSDALTRNAVGVVNNSASRANFQNVLIRGFDVSFNFLKNGIPESFFNLTPPRDLSNVERLEVLSGPASIIGGQISPGGIVNVVTKQPLSSPLFELSATYGSFKTVEGALDLSGPLNDNKTVAYRLNTSIYHSDTFSNVDNVGVDRFLIAPVLSWQVGDRTKINFEGMYLNSRTPQRIGLPAQGTVLDNPNGKIPRNQFIGDPNFDGNDREITQIGYDIQHDFNDNWSLRHAFRYSNLQREQREFFINSLEDDLRTLDASRDIVTSDINNYQVTFYATGKFATGDVNHKLIAGIDYFYEDISTSFEFFEAEKIDLFNPVFTGGLENSFRSGGFVDTSSAWGIYLQDQMKIFDDRLILVLGGRIDIASSFSQDDTAFSPNVGILYKIRDNFSVYGSFSRSFEQVFGLKADNTTFDPSRGTQYEVGLKADWLEGRLSTTLAYYDLTLSNLTTSNPNDPQFDIQTGEQNSKGVELRTIGEILPGWNIVASYAYTDAKITRDNNFTVGNALANVPNNVVNLWTTYTIQEGDLEGLGFGLGFSYVGERQGDLDNSFQLGSYFRTDAGVFYRRDNLRLALNIQNLFDVNYFDSSDGFLRVNQGEPFKVLFSASYQF